MPLKKRRRPLYIFKDVIEKKGITYKEVALAIGRGVRATENILNGYSIPLPIDIIKLKDFVISIKDFPEKEKKPRPYKKEKKKKGDSCNKLQAINKKCLFCGKEFITIKTSKISCSGSCYQKHYREMNKIKNSAYQLSYRKKKKSVDSCSPACSTESKKVAQTVKKKGVGDGG